MTDSAPTFKTPLDPTTMPFGETKMTFPSEKPPAPLTAFKIPLILI